mmetsp:Transcript_24884/g.44801  ORF Transcript_24884/g.44801 Transcript_24884/m.44801 type:complete len:696 (-) Transcript_24884:186-2273(-)|eukprot:CAMPEP_0196131216 /NCGR_PEP_ID=MMETSP0910-20130528/1315_1 /TAXON_ID=49265 /ORGANISM="Thalassiosira rotula, Strain GSO102" /LENGTH=695 /DNA_ID=CAMNT_0041390665 /DNA_START=75 /DNA_END=2162 /DNA_ORIENTATION=-
MVATASIKMDELLVTWLGSETIYENVMRIIESQKESSNNNNNNRPATPTKDSVTTTARDANNIIIGSDGSGAAAKINDDDGRPPLSPKLSKKPRPEIPPFFRKQPTPPSDSDGTTSLPPDNPQNPPPAPPKRRLNSSFSEDQTWDGIYMVNREGGGGGEEDRNHEFDRDSIATDGSLGTAGAAGATGAASSNAKDKKPCIALQAKELFQELGVTPSQHRMMMEQEGNHSPQSANVPAILSQYLRSPSDAYHTTEDDCRYVPMERFERVTKELCNLPTFFHKPLYERILRLWESHLQARSGKKLPSLPVITHGVFHHFWEMEMAPYDMNERFFRLLKQPEKEYITRDDFFPYIKELLSDHPGLEFLSNHAEFQDKYAVTVITRIFYSVNLCHSGRITSRQMRKSNLLSVFQQVDEEEDINKVTKYFSYEHFYVLYCRFWELDHDRDYKITREDLLKYGEHSLSHMIVDRIFDAAPRPFEGNDNASSSANNAPNSVDENGNAVQKPTSTRDFLTYEDFIFFMLSEEDKANEFSVRYWFTCVDVDGDDKLNNMEMRSFYAVQLHRMQCMGHEVVPFEDMLCQMMDMIKPANTECLVVEDFLGSHCSQVSGALFDALFNVNKYVMFEQRDPFLERQKREDEFDTDWDRFACIDYNRLAMEEEQREEEAMEVDWVNMDEEEEDGDDYNAMGLSGSSEAPF